MKTLKLIIKILVAGFIFLLFTSCFSSQLTTYTGDIRIVWCDNKYVYYEPVNVQEDLLYVVKMRNLDGVKAFAGDTISIKPQYKSLASSKY